MNATPKSRGSARERIGELDLGVVLGLLRNRRRRLVLDALSADDAAPFDEVVDYVVREEVGLGYSEEERKRVHVALYQNHVPKLDDANVVEYEATDTPLTRGCEFEEVYGTLERLREVASEEGGEVQPLRVKLSKLLRGG